MRNLITLVLAAVLIAISSGCKDSCIDCTIEHFQDLSVIAEVKDICGDEDELAAEEQNLSVEYRCVQCIVYTTITEQNTGILCGTREYTDSIEASNIEAAIQSNSPYTCEFFSDTLIITCHPAAG